MPGEATKDLIESLRQTNNEITTMSTSHYRNEHNPISKTCRISTGNKNQLFSRVLTGDYYGMIIGDTA